MEKHERSLSVVRKTFHAAVPVFDEKRSPAVELNDNPDNAQPVGEEMINCRKYVEQKASKKIDERDIE